MANDPTAKLTIRLSHPVHEELTKLANAKHYEVGAYAQRILTDHVIKFGDMPAIEARKAELTNLLIDGAVEEAVALHKSDGIDPHFTLNVFRRLAEKAEWRAMYEELIDGDAYADGLPGKFPINMYLGWHIKNAVDAMPVQTATGKAKRVQVKGELIQSYTVLQAA